MNRIRVGKKSIVKKGAEKKKRTLGEREKRGKLRRRVEDEKPRDL